MKQDNPLPGWTVTSRLSLAGLGLFVFLADQISKGWAQRLPEQLPFAVMPNLQVVRVENPGIAFSLFAHANPAWRMGLVLLSGLALLGVAWQGFRRPRARGAQAGLIMILSGAAGNLMDRLLFGRVTDFLQVSAGHHEGPIFNVADMAITTGATILVWAILREKASTGGEPAPVGDL